MSDLFISKALHGSKKPRRGVAGGALHNAGRAELASIWIHLNRVRSTFSKSAAETSGRFLRHRMEGTEKTWHGERLARARISNSLLESLCLALTDPVPS